MEGTNDDYKKQSEYKNLTHKFDKMMKALYGQRGAQLDIDILASDEAQSFINAHAGILDSTFKQVKMSDKMRERLTRSNYIFSGIKTFHELNEAFPSLLDEDGDRKPFERFLNDVRKIDETYNANYLHAEYNFVQASAEMAAKWEQYSEDGDRYLLQYRTAHDDKVRPEHAALDRITLPMSDPFWESYYPPNGWNCRCTVVQVRRGKYEETPHNEAMSRGEEVLNGEKLSIFRFNSGKQGKTVPDYNPYTIKRCNDCDVAKGKLGLVNEIVDNQLCAACRCVYNCQSRGSYTLDAQFGERLKISNLADKTEVEENTRAAHALLSSFPNMSVQIRKHVFEDGVKNPEYLINEKVADRKGIESTNGIASGFKKAIKQGCEVVVLDLDMHPKRFEKFPSIRLASGINNRYMDFKTGIIKECYIIYRNKAVLIDNGFFTDDIKASKENIKRELEKIKGD